MTKIKIIRSRNFFDIVAGEYDDVASCKQNFTSPREVFNAIRGDIYSCDDKVRVLDVGCGTGLVGELIRESFPNVALTGMDFSDISLIKADAKRSLNGERIYNSLLQHDINEKFPLRMGDSFDFVIASGVFEFLPNIRNAVLEMKRVLKPEGKMVLTVDPVDCKACDDFDDLRGVELLLSPGDQVQCMTYAHSQDDVMCAFEDAGMRVEVEKRFQAYEFSGQPVDYTLYEARRF